MRLMCSWPVQPVSLGEAVVKHRLVVLQNEANRLHHSIVPSRIPSPYFSSALWAVLLRILATMNSTYRHSSSHPPDQNSRRQEHQGSDVSSLQTLDFEAPSPDNMLRSASAVSSRTLSTHGSNISLWSHTLSAVSRASADRTALEPADHPQATSRQQQSTKPDVKEAKCDDGKRSTSSLLPNWQWKFETSLLFLSVCSLVVIIILLAVEDGTALDSWKFYFSLNAVVSALGTISRASLASSIGSCIAQEKWNWFCKRQDSLYLFDRFDSASRGPLGSFKLLYWLKLR